MNEAWSHPLIHPIQLPDGKSITTLEFPKMKGKYMRKFTARVDASETPSIEYDQFMMMGEAMLGDVHGKIVARLIFEEMDPEDVHQVVAAVGERFAGGQPTGKNA